MPPVNNFESKRLIKLVVVSILHLESFHKFLI